MCANALTSFGGCKWNWIALIKTRTNPEGGSAHKIADDSQCDDQTWNYLACKCLFRQLDFEAVAPL